MNLYNTPVSKKGIAENNVIDGKDFYKYNTQVYQFYHPKQEMQFVPNIIQTNRRDIILPETDLVNLESELRGITRNLSKVPESRYLGPNSCSKKYNDKGLCTCQYCFKRNVVNTNKNESVRKIVNNHHIPNYKNCSVRRTSSSNSQCNNKFDTEKNMLDTIKSFFF